MYNRPMEFTVRFLEEKFKSKPDILAANLKVLKAGYYFGDTREEFTTRYSVGPAKMPPGIYRNIMGNQPTAMGLEGASEKQGLPIFYVFYPIIPPSIILLEL